MSDLTAWVEGRSRKPNRGPAGIKVHASTPGAKRSLCGVELAYMPARGRRPFDPRSDGSCRTCVALTRKMTPA